MFWRCFNTANRMGWRIVDYNEKEGRIEATATSFWFGQIADIVIRVRPAGTLGARFDMRAESETGAPRFRRNLELMKTYRAALNTCDSARRSTPRPGHPRSYAPDAPRTVSAAARVSPGGEAGIKRLDQRRHGVACRAAGRAAIWALAHPPVAEIGAQERPRAWRWASHGWDRECGHRGRSAFPGCAYNRPYCHRAAPPRWWTSPSHGRR